MTSPSTHVLLEVPQEIAAGSGAVRTVGKVAGAAEDFEHNSGGTDEVSDAELDSYVATAAMGNLAQVPALSAYLRQVERYPQLSAEDQLERVRVYQRARDEAQQLEGQLRSGELKGGARGKTRAKMLRAQRTADETLDLLCGGNFRLALTISRELAVGRYGMAKGLAMLPDLVSEANLALTEAVQTYDEAKDPRSIPSFPTFAARMIRDRVRACLARQGQPMRVPPSWRRIRRIAHMRLPQLESELGRKPTRDELREDLMSRCMAWAESKLTDADRELSEAEQRDKCLKKLRKQGMLGALDNLDEVLNSPSTVSSLDAPVGEDGGATLGDFQVDGDGDGDLFRGVELAELRDSLRLALGQLSEREQRILLLRYGFADGEKWTYAAICEEFGVTAERIRQIERAALNRLRSPHAHYAHLSSHLPSQFDEPDGDRSAVSAARRRSQKR